MSEPKLIPFSADYQLITSSGQVESNCCGILFINLGAAVCSVLGFPMQQGQQLSIPCNIGEIDKTNYKVQFSGSGAQQLLVIRKNY